MWEGGHNQQDTKEGYQFLEYIVVIVLSIGAEKYLSKLWLLLPKSNI